MIKSGKQQYFEEEFQVVTDFYKNNFARDVLKAQLITFGVEFHPKIRADKDLTFLNIKNHLTSLSSAHRNLSEVVKLLQLILVMPATNSSSERSCALRRVKTYLTGTMLQGRLNIHVHHHHSDSVNLKEIVNEFVSGSEVRFRIFEIFKLVTSSNIIVEHFIY